MQLGGPVVAGLRASGYHGRVLRTVSCRQWEDMSAAERQKHGTVMQLRWHPAFGCLVCACCAAVDLTMVESNFGHIGQQFAGRATPHRSEKGTEEAARIEQGTQGPQCRRFVVRNAERQTNRVRFCARKNAPFLLHMTPRTFAPSCLVFCSEVDRCAG